MTTKCDGAVLPSLLTHPVPLAALALLAVNDHALKPAFHNAVTGKLSDVALCFFLPILLAELGRLLCVRASVRIAGAALVTALVFAPLELSESCTQIFCAALAHVGPWLGVQGPFVMTRDASDLWTLLCVPLGVAWVQARERAWLRTVERAAQ
jgi:hypothetical protein